jgi:8-oxo-dGTP diphosphatase
LKPEIRVVCAAIVRDGHVLVAQRGPAKSQAGLWELPGGKVEPGETDMAALRREIREELGLAITVREPIGESVHAYEHAVVRLVAYRCDYVGGVADPTEHSAILWASAAQLETLGWAPADVPLIPCVVTLLCRRG